jgi:predicted RNase H-like nuclease (RuvC/YqgF family)
MQHPDKSEDKLVFMQKVDENDYPTSKISLVEEKAEAPQKRDTTKVYFFIIAILALIATNVYFYIKYQSSEEYSYGLSTEMAYMQDEIDRIEAELNRLTSENTELSKSLQASEDSVRMLIASLREKLNEQNLTRLELNNAQAEIDRLREDVIRYKDDLAALNEQNEALLAENQILQREVTSKQDRVQALEQANKGLSDQIRAAAVLKLSNINVMGIRELKGNKESVDDKARRVDRIRVIYTLADNPLVQHGDIEKL